MKICVYGLWHLGSVTAGCLAESGFDVVGLDPDAGTIANLNRGVPPLYEPGLEELIQAGLQSGRLSFSSDRAVVADADLVWVAFDTPVFDDDRADVDYVKNCVRDVFPYLKDGAVLLISSQLPVGSVAGLERDFAAAANGRKVSMACSPENLRLGKAISVFRNLDFVAVGLRGDAGKEKIAQVFAPFTGKILWMRTESAEMTKHALNSFLATSVTFINEIASLCEQVGADAAEVEDALRSEPRIGRAAYIRPGAAFAGGTLARDVAFIDQLARDAGLSLPMIGNIIASNNCHRGWSLRLLQRRLGALGDKVISVLGLSYKQGTDALRRSMSIELCRNLLAAGARVQAFDPAVKALPEDLTGRISLAGAAADALTGAEAVVVMSEWPEFRNLQADTLVERTVRPLLVDQNRFISQMAQDPRIEYVTIGRPQ